MSADYTGRAPMDGPRRAPASEAQQFTHSLRRLWDDVRLMGRDHALLAVLEVQRAGLSLVKIFAAGLVAALLVVTAWLALVGSAVAWAAGEGTPWWVGLVVASVGNLVFAGVLAFWIRSKLPDLMFAATVRQLKREPPSQEP
jgi:uncharacterized membrane protein YdbT with pleckstrin-like domain